MEHIEAMMRKPNGLKLEYLFLESALNYGEVGKGKLARFFDEEGWQKAIREMIDKKYLEEKKTYYKVLNKAEVINVVMKNMNKTSDVWAAVRYEVEYITRNFLILDNDFIKKINNSGLMQGYELSLDSNLAKREDYFMHFRNIGRGSILTLLALERLLEITYEQGVSYDLDECKQELVLDRKDKFLYNLKRSC